MKGESQYDVLIVGFSMLGNIAALLLAEYGLRVVVVEKRQLSDLLVSKTARIDDEVMLMMQQLGLKEALNHLVYPLKGIQIADKDERLLLEFNHPTKSSFAPLYGFYQPNVQRLLQQKALVNPLIKLVLGTEVEAFEQDSNDDLQVFVRPVEQNSFLNIKASYLLVCNGQFSNIADYIDIAVEDFKYNSSVLCVDTRSEHPLTANSYAQTVYNAQYPVTRFLQNKHQLRFEFQLDKSTLETAGTPEQVRKMLDASTDGLLQVESAFVYNFRVRMLSDWWLDRVLIAGDAAHVMPPFLGMGLSAGIKDIYNLAWKLNLVCRHNASASLLSTYQQERSSNVRKLIQLNLWIKRLFKSSKMRWIKGLVPVLPKRFKQRKLTITNRITKGIVFPPNQAKETVIAVPIMDEKGHKTTLNQVLGTYFGLLALDENPVDALLPDSIETMAYSQTRFFQLTSKTKRFQKDARYSSNIYDSSGALKTYMKKNKARYIIVRPDRVVYAFCKNKTVLNEAIRALDCSLSLQKNSNPLNI